MSNKIKYLILVVTLYCCHIALFSQQTVIDSLQNVLSTAKEDTNKVNTLNLLCREFELTGDYEKGINYSNQAKQLAEKLNFKKGIAKAYNGLGNCNAQQGNYPEALKNHFASLKIREEIGDKGGIAMSYNNIGLIYEHQGNYPEALKNYFASLKIKEEIGDKKGIAISYNNIGNIYYYQGNYPEALKNYFASLKIKEEIGDKKGIASSYNNIGVIYEHQGNYPEALKNFFASLKIKEEIGDKKGIANSYNNIGNIYNAQGNYPEVHRVERDSLFNLALKNYFASLKIKEEIGDIKGIADSYNNIGIIYAEQANYPEVHQMERDSLLNLALKNFFASLKIYEEIGDKRGIAMSYVSLGIVNTKLKKFTEAKKYLNDGLLLSKEIGYMEAIKESYNGLSVLDSAEGNFKKAYEDYKMFIVYRDSLINEENLKKTVQIQTRYEFEKEQIKKEQAALKQAQDEKERINRRNILQYTIILLFIMVVLGVVMSLGFIKVSERLALGLIFVSLLLVFEFILVFMDPYVDNLTKGVPIYKLIINVMLATLIFPVHGFWERRFRNRAKKVIK